MKLSRLFIFWEYERKKTLRQISSSQSSSSSSSNLKVSTDLNVCRQLLMAHTPCFELGNSSEMPRLPVILGYSVVLRASLQ